MNRLISNQRACLMILYVYRPFDVIGPVVLSSKAHICVSGFVIVTETCFCSHSPISRVTTHLRDSSSVPFSCASSVPIFDLLRTEAEGFCWARRRRAHERQPRSPLLTIGAGAVGLLVASLGGRRRKGQLVVNASPATSRKVGLLLMPL